MFEYRNVFVRMRLGDFDRAIATTKLLGLKKVRQLRSQGLTQRWLDTTNPLSDDKMLAKHISPLPRLVSSILF